MISNGGPYTMLVGDNLISTMGAMLRTSWHHRHVGSAMIPMPDPNSVGWSVEVRSHLPRIETRADDAVIHWFVVSFWMIQNIKSSQ